MAKLSTDQLRVLRVFQSNLSILSFHVTCTLSLHLSSIFFFFSFAKFLHCRLNVFHHFFLYLGPPCISKIIFMVKSERVLRSVSSLPSAKELLVLILNTILILVDDTFLVLLCFDLLCIFIKLEVDLHVFAQRSTSMAPFLDRELQFKFSALFWFAIHHGSL